MQYSFFIVAIIITTVSGANIIGYWGCNPGGHRSTVAQLSTALSRGYNVIIYAFYNVDENGNLIPDPGAVGAPVKSSVSNGGRSWTYLVSLFGGETGRGPTLSITPEAWAQAMYNNFVQLRSRLGFDGIDIDLENAWGGTPNSIVCGLRRFFQLMKGGGYIISMAPQTTAVTPEVGSYMPGAWNSYSPLCDTSIINYVDIVAVQLYNNAVPYNSPESYAKALSTGFQVSGCPSCSIPASCLVRIPVKKIAFGYPAGVGAAPSGCPGLPGGCPYGNTLTTMYSGGPTLITTGGVMTWSVEWDEYSNWQFVTAATRIQFR